MNRDNRVLGRAGARELTPSETEAVNGAFKTSKAAYTICTPCDADCPGNDCGCDREKVYNALNVFTICTGIRPCGDGDCA